MTSLDMKINSMKRVGSAIEEFDGQKISVQRVIYYPDVGVRIDMLDKEFGEGAYERLKDLGLEFIKNFKYNLECEGEVRLGLGKEGAIAFLNINTHNLDCNNIPHILRGHYEVLDFKKGIGQCIFAKDSRGSLLHIYC